MSKKKDGLLWTVTYHKDEGVKITPGSELSRYESDAQVAIIARQMVTIGSRLIGASLEDDDEWGDDE